MKTIRAQVHLQRNCGEVSGAGVIAPGLLALYPYFRLYLQNNPHVSYYNLPL